MFVLYFISTLTSGFANSSYSLGAHEHLQFILSQENVENVSLERATACNLLPIYPLCCVFLWKGAANVATTRRRSRSGDGWLGRFPRVPHLQALGPWGQMTDEGLPWRLRLGCCLLRVCGRQERRQRALCNAGGCPPSLLAASGCRAKPLTGAPRGGFLHPRAALSALGGLAGGDLSPPGCPHGSVRGTFLGRPLRQRKGKRRGGAARRGAHNRALVRPGEERRGRAGRAGRQRAAAGRRHRARRAGAMRQHRRHRGEQRQRRR